MKTTLMYMFLNEVNFNLREDHVVYMSFHWVTTTLSLLRTTTCDTLIVPSDLVGKEIHKLKIPTKYL